MAHSNIENDYENIKVETAGAQNDVGIITFHRPRALNALSNKLILEMNAALNRLEDDDRIGAIVITGGDKVFAAGGDIKEMQTLDYEECFRTNFLANWERVSRVRKPVIAAVNGLTLGGGCEIAMMCDIIYAGETALFGQPEILIGTIPGAGGTQRLPRCIGKSKAMEMILTGDRITAAEAERIGLVSKVFPVEKLLQEAVKLGEKIAANSPHAVAVAKETINRGYETSLAEGINFERKAFHATFASIGRKEGMAAFTEKRSAHYNNKY